MTTPMPQTELVGKKRLLDRIDELVSVVPITGCWLWMGAIAVTGYARTSVWDGTRNVGVAAHRVVYTEAKGRIRPGMHIDHLCRNRWCVNPDHLEEVTPRVNVMRGHGATARNARKTRCNSGHALSGRNLIVEKSGSRRCRACRRARQQERKDRGRASA